MSVPPSGRLRGGREEDLRGRAEDIGEDRRHADPAEDQEDLEEQEEPPGGLHAAAGVLVVVTGRKEGSHWGR